MASRKPVIQRKKNRSRRKRRRKKYFHQLVGLRFEIQRNLEGSKYWINSHKNQGKEVKEFQALLSTGHILNEMFFLVALLEGKESLMTQIVAPSKVNGPVQIISSLFCLKSHFTKVPAFVKSLWYCWWMHICMAVEKRHFCLDSRKIAIETHSAVSSRISIRTV